MVMSCRKNFMQRSLIRQTYGSIRFLNNVHILAVVFMLGGLDAPGTDKVDISKLEAERVEFGDVIMGDFVDTYRNLTRKAIMAYDWLRTFCQEADIVVKTDDDVMLNIFKLTEELAKWTPTVLRSFNFWCSVHWGENIDKNDNSMYYISPEQYSGAALPTHCAGMGYITPMGMIHRIADKISKSFPGIVCTHEDAFMTGIVPEKINAAKNDPIEYVDKNNDWTFHFDGNEGNEDVRFIWKLLQQSANETVEFSEVRTHLGIFYLLEHTAEFEKVYLWLWHLVKHTYRNEKMTIKIDII